jgi:NADH dehydrogenase
VAEIRGAQISGLPAWLVWLGVHPFFLIGLQYRLVVMVRWTLSYLTRTGSARLVTPTGETELEDSRERVAGRRRALDEPAG